MISFFQSAHFTFLIFTYWIVTSTIAISQSRGSSQVDFPEQLSGRTRALIIGVSDYPNLDSLKQLNYAHTDALLFQDLILSVPGLANKEDVTLLINSEANNMFKILTRFKQMLQDSEAGDMVILFFAGHGDIQNVLGDEQGYLLLNHIAEPNIVDYEGTQDVLPLSKLNEYVTRAKANKDVKVMLVFDACHSGKLVSTEDNSKVVLAALSEKMKNTINLVSSQHDELSYEGSKWGGGHGVFTWFLVNGAKGLADTNNDGKVSLLELKNYIQTNVSAATDDKQLPIVNGSERETVFLTQKDLLAEAKKEIKQGVSKVNAANQGDVAARGGAKNGARGFSAPAHPELLKSLNTVMITRLVKELLAENKILPPAEKQEVTELDQSIKVSNHQSLSSAHKKNAWAISTTNTGDLVASAGEEGLVVLWSYPEKKKIVELDHKWVKSLAFSDDDNYLVTGGSRDVKLWDMNSNKLVHTFSGHKASIRSVIFDVTGKFILSASEDGTINCWDIKNRNLHTTIKQANGKAFTCLVNGMTPNQIISGDASGNVIVWDIATGKEISKFNIGKEVASLSLAWGVNQIVAGDNVGRAKVIDLKKMSLVKEVNLGIEDLNTILTDSEANFIAGGGRLWKYPIYNLLTNSMIQNTIEIPRGITAGHYNPFLHEIFLALNGGGWMTLKVDAPRSVNGGSVFEVYTTSIKSGLTPKEKERLVELIVNNVLIKASVVLDPFISNASNLPSYEETIQLKEELKWAIEINDQTDFLSRKLKDYLLLAETLETILSGDFSQLDRGLKQLLELKKSNPDASYVNCLIAGMYQKMKKLKEAKSEADMAASRIPDWVEPKLSIANTLFLGYKYDEADNLVSKVIAEAPSLSKAFIQKAKIQAVIGNYGEALMLFENAVTMDPQNVSYLFDFGLFHLRNGNLSEAATIANKIAGIDESHYGSYFIKGEIKFYEYAQQKNNSINSARLIHEEAYKFYLKALEYGPRVPLVNLRIADFYAHSLNNKAMLKENYLNIPMEESINSESRRAKAIARLASDYYKIVLKADPFMCQAKIGEIRMLLFRNPSKESKSRADRTFKSLEKNNTPEDCHCLAMNLHQSGEDKKAVKWIKKAIDLDTENVLYYLKLIEYTHIEKSKDAAVFLEKNYPNLNRDYFKRKNISEYSFFNY
jgi:WD40 repeat protein/tetratricopeptide (TPR) repeat protein